MVSTASIFFVSFILLLEQGQCCDDGWLLYRDHCYHIFSDLAVTKRRAEIDCHLKNSNLVSITNKGRWEFLTNEINKVNKSSYWVGLTRKEGNLEWENGEVEESRPWVQVTDLLGYGEDECFVLKNYTVITRSCNSAAGYICEKHQNPENNTVRISCLQQEDQKKICLWFVSESLTRDEGEQACAKHDGRLAVLDARQKEIFAKFLTLLKHGSYWIGLNRSDGVFLWSTGDQLDETGLLWPFVRGSSSGECVTMDTNLTIEVGTQWRLRDCNEKAFSLCEDVKLENITSHSGIISSSTESSSSTTPEPEPKCPEGNNWVDNGRGFCYWETSYETEKLPWPEARRYCQGYGGDLASIHSYDDERKGYLFQALLLGHTYWIGLTYNYTTKGFDWSDGTAVTYTNWAINQPNTNDRRLRCVAVNPRERAWEVSDCNNLNWFVCKAPKSVNPPPFKMIPPSPEPLIPCASDINEYFFEDYCYTYVKLPATWRKSKLSCQRSGSQLVSIHSTQETNFLRRLIEQGNVSEVERTWIGLQHNFLDGTLGWADGTAVDYTNWNSAESIISRQIQRCCFMYPNGLWHCTLCYLSFGYICKRPNITDTTITIPSTTSEAVANCKAGWYPFENKCYLPIGEKPEDRKNWRDANIMCNSLGAKFVSVHSTKQQEFLEYLMTKVQTHTWIGLHDHIDDSAYVWADNSRMDYYNWAFGEPSNYEYKEDCVQLSYKMAEFGLWRDEDCNRKHPFICEMDKDLSIATPWTPVASDPCTDIGGFQLGKSCYLIFDKEDFNQEYAAKHCADKDGDLVSIKDIIVQVFLKHLVSNTNTYFWTGLSRERDGTFRWTSGWPVTYTNWGNNEPGLPITFEESSTEPTCYLMSSSGLWLSENCSRPYPYICEITKEKPPSRPAEALQGSCPTNSRLWKDIGNRYCYIFEPVTTQWRRANMRCSQQGGSLASIHTEKELINISKFANQSEPIFIGLARNRYGGFAWTDGTPVNFVSWERNGIQSDLNCVELRPNTQKWRTVNCTESRGFLCSIEKDITAVSQPSTLPSNFKTAESASQVEAKSRALSPGAVTGIVICVILMILLGIGVAFHFRSYMRRRKSSVQNRSIISFENTIYMDPSNEHE